MQQAKKPLRTVIFRVGGDRYGLIASSVAEVVDSGRLTPVPQTRPWLIGAVHFQGGLIPVLDMHGLLGRGASGGSGNRLIVLSYEGRFVALRVDGVDDIHDLENLRVKTVVVRDYDSAIEGVGTVGDRHFFLLNTEKLINAEKPFDRHVERLVLDKVQGPPS